MAQVRELIVLHDELLDVEVSENPNALQAIWSAVKKLEKAGSTSFNVWETVSGTGCAEIEESDWHQALSRGARYHKRGYLQSHPDPERFIYFESPEHSHVAIPAAFPEVIWVEGSRGVWSKVIAFDEAFLADWTEDTRRLIVRHIDQRQTFSVERMMQSAISADEHRIDHDTDGNLTLSFTFSEQGFIGLEHYVIDHLWISRFDTYIFTLNPDSYEVIKFTAQTDLPNCSIALHGNEFEYGSAELPAGLTDESAHN